MIELRDYQREAIDSIFKYFEEGNTGNPLVVAPTGAGKSIIITKFMEEVLKAFPNQKLLLLAHRKELIEQNLDKLLKIWPEAPIGIYSAGLGKRQLGRKITFVGIHSIFDKGYDLEFVDLVLIDECHLIPPEGEGMYNTLFKALKHTNPKVRFIGFTATAFRMKTGSLIDDGGTFTDISCDIPIRRLLNQRHLSPLVSKTPRTQADLTDVKVRGGEFVQSEMEAVFNNSELIRQALNEVETYAKDRKSWLFFCSGVAHAEAVTKDLRNRGYTAEMVSGETPSLFRDQHISDFKQGKIQCLVNCDVFTTGFDAPNVDALILLRGTKSAGLYVQIAGRGMRNFPGKKNCLFLDFGGNIERHGPVDEIRLVKRGKNKGKVGFVPSKTCPVCQTSIHAIKKECPECGYIFPANPNHDPFASSAAVLSSQIPPVTKKVTSINYKIHKKEGKPPSLKIEYQCGLVWIYEWACFEHGGPAAYKASHWWLIHHKDWGVKSNRNITIPKTTQEAWERLRELKRPAEITYVIEGRFERIIKVAFESGESIESSEELLNKYGLNL